jgi:RNA polymerase-binding protein DksA
MTLANSRCHGAARARRLRPDRGPRFARLRRWLIEERQSLLSDLETSQRDRWAPDAGADHIDAASAEREIATTLQVMTNGADTLEQIERALARMEDGTYGLCEECGRPIAYRRLRALPFASLCRRCKEREERSGPASRQERPIRPHATAADVDAFWADDAGGLARHMRIGAAFRAA